MKIEVLKLFLHGRDRFEAGDIRTVSDEDGAYFVKNGWAKPAGTPTPASPSPAAVKLDIKSATHAQEARHG